MFNATCVIETELKKAGFKCHIQDAGELSYVEAGFSGATVVFTIRFISVDNDNDVRIMTNDFAKIISGKTDKILVLLNRLNREYRYAKFTVSDDEGIFIQYDVPSQIESSSLGAIALEIAIRFAKIIDDVYPMIMKEIWG